MNEYSILIVDDHPIVLEGIKSIIQTIGKYEVKDVVHSVTDAIELLKQNDYDLLITDYEMPGMTGMELIQLARAISPNIKTMVISMHDEPAVIKQLLNMDLNGFILKNDIQADLSMALDRIFSGGIYLSDEITTLLINHNNKSSTTALTPREKEIVRLIVKEYSTRQIAEILQLSEKTVETHRKNILKKTGASNLVALIKYAFSNDLI